MKEVVFTKPPYMNASERRIADLHSVLNILNVVLGELSLIEPKDGDLLAQRTRLEEDLKAIVTAIRSGSSELAGLNSRVKDFEGAIINFAKASLEVVSEDSHWKEISESIGNFKSIFSILGKRLHEFELRADNPDVWIQIHPDAFQQQFEEVFGAIVRNAKGAYGIQFNLAKKNAEDYRFDLKVDADAVGGMLCIPLRLLDVFRDLTANARKYTPPGGTVSLEVTQDESHIRGVVKDTGCGIPNDEIEKVVEFGYRARNVRKRPTLGGGFGLTKAVWLVTSWGGSLHIESALDEGTTINLSVPNTEQNTNLLTWTL